MIAALRTTTSTALLEGLFDQSNDSVWREFDARYRPILFGVGRKLGLNEQDADDVAQETLIQFVRAYHDGKYDRKRGRLRSWIIGIVKHRVADLYRARAGRREWRGESALLHIPDDDHLTQIWETQRRRAVLLQAVTELREESKLNERTIRAFEFYVIHERPAAEVARDLGLTRHDVYVAKSNVARRLREILGRLEELFDDG